MNIYANLNDIQKLIDYNFTDEWHDYLEHSKHGDIRNLSAEAVTEIAKADHTHIFGTICRLQDWISR